VRLALDTNRYVDLARGLEPTTALASRADVVYLPLLVLGELRAGFGLGRRAHENEQVLRRFLNKRGVEVLAPDELTTVAYASVFAQLRRQGTPIPTNDIWIAALVLQHGVLLHARDQHFDHLPQIPRV